MIYDLLSSAPHAHSYAEVCIVGAGAAGIGLATELSRSGVRVALLDGGGAEFERRAQEPYFGETVGLEHRGFQDGRFRVFGGTTTRWGGQVLEMHDIDFRQRSWIPGSGWPIGKSQLEPYYERALDAEGLGKALRDDSAVWRAMGERETSFPGMTANLSRWCPEPNFAKLRRGAIESSTHIDLWLHTNAVELVVDGTRAVGVRARTQTGKQAVFRARKFVFCMGAIESSRFFLQPRDGALPWNESGLLGCHFQDHLDCNAAIFLPKRLNRVRRSFDGIFHNGIKYQPRIRLDDESQERLGTLNVGSSFAYEHVDIEEAWRVRTTAQHLLKRRFSSVEAADLRHLFHNVGFATKQGLRYAFRRRSFQPTDAAISLRVHCEQEPKSQSRLDLSHQRDSVGLYRARLDWRISPLELDSIRAYVTAAKLSLAELGEVVPTPCIDDDVALTGLCQDSFHHMGGMRMHDSPFQGVVDCDLKLHGVQNAWICSSAVFPTSGSSNPTHTLIALAMRLADRLARPESVVAVQRSDDRDADEVEDLSGEPLCTAPNEALRATVSRSWEHV